MVNLATFSLFTFSPCYITVLPILYLSNNSKTEYFFGVFLKKQYINKKKISLIYTTAPSSI